MSVLQFEEAPLLPAGDPQPVAPADTYYQADYTVNASQLARELGHIKDGPEDGAELFFGREQITRDTSDIDGKVDIRAWSAGAEAIVVDSKKYPAGFNKLLNNFTSRLEIRQQDPTRDVLNGINNAVRATMEYDLPYVNAKSDQVRMESPNARKVSIGEYFIDGKGVCRHMALAASWLGGKAKEYGALDGEFTTGANKRNKEGDWSGHEWGRYTSKDGQVYIVDPAQNFVGTIEEAAANPNRWEYFKDEAEKARVIAKQVGEPVIIRAVEVDEPMTRVVELPLSMQYDRFMKGDELLRADIKQADRLSAQDRLSLRATAQAYLKGAQRLLEAGIDQQGIAYAHQVQDEIIAPLAKALAVKRPYSKDLIVDAGAIKGWLSTTLAAAEKTYAAEADDDNFKLVSAHSPRIRQQLWRAFGKK